MSRDRPSNLTTKPDPDEFGEVLKFFQKFGSGEPSETTGTAKVTASDKDSEALKRCVVKLSFLSCQNHNFALDIENTNLQAVYTPLNNLIGGYVSKSQQVDPYEDLVNEKTFQITGDNGKTTEFKITCTEGVYDFDVNAIINTAKVTKKDITITIPRLDDNGKPTGVNDYIIFSKFGHFTWVPGDQENMGKSQISEKLCIDLSESMRIDLKTLAQPDKKTEREKIFGGAHKAKSSAGHTPAPLPTGPAAPPSHIDRELNNLNAGMPHYTF